MSVRYLGVCPFGTIVEFTADEAETPKAAALCLFEEHIENAEVGWEVLIVEPEHAHRFVLGVEPVAEEAGKLREERGD